MSTFLDALYSGRVLLMDGAMGTELQKAGLPSGESGELWNYFHPERVRGIHQAYADAGAEVLLTNTFQANRLANPQIEVGRLAIVCQVAADLARRVAGTSRWVLADIGSMVDPKSGREFEDPLHVEFAATYTGPADAILIETCSSPRAGQTAKRLRRLPQFGTILLSLTYLHNDAGQLATRSGHSPEWFASRAESWGVAALGVNCGRDIDMDDIIEVIRRYRNVTDLPLFARPNAGTPKQVKGRWVYPLTPKAMAQRLPELLEAGVAMVGGCCGTTPEYIAAMRPIIEAWNARRSS
jgi:5-methyltetrahydrofolate--homocysteine methyltransferase